jgi:hypothetical protein
MQVLGRAAASLVTAHQSTPTKTASLRDPDFSASLQRLGASVARQAQIYSCPTRESNLFSPDFWPTSASLLVESSAEPAYKDIARNSGVSQIMLFITFAPGAEPASAKKVTMVPAEFSKTPRFATLSVLLLLLALCLGCGSKQLEEIANQAKQGLDQATQQASEVGKQAEKSIQQLPGAVAAVTAGEIQLTLDAPLSATTCAARFTPPAKDRTGLFQIGTNISTGPTSFPAVYFHGPTEVASLQDLVGKSVPGTLFVAKSEAQGHYQSPSDKPLSLTIVKIENNVVTCQIQNAELLSPEQAQPTPVAGTLVGALQP